MKLNYQVNNEEEAVKCDTGINFQREGVSEETCATRSRRTASAWKKRIETSCSETFTIQLLKRRLPIIVWLPTYSWRLFFQDLIAGITVGLTNIPQSLGYATVAGLPLQYGLYSAIMGVFVYVVFGTVKEAAIGPSAISALMTYTYTKQGGQTYAVLLAFLGGWIELSSGLFNLGFIMEIISAPVISGFCSAAALTVASTQLNGLFGMKIIGTSFLEIWRGFFDNLVTINAFDASLGWSTIVLLLLMRKLSSLKNLGLLKKVKCLHNRYTNGTLWFIAASRNAFAVIGGCFVTYFLEKHSNNPFTLTGVIDSQLPPLTVPSFSINRLDCHNNTVHLGFGDVCAELGIGIALIPLINILQLIAIAKAFSNGKRTDATQEMIALGLGNILTSFLGGMPCSASFGRSSVQAASGAQTPLVNFYVGVLILLSLGFLMPTLAYIPKAVLAAVIVTSVIFMFELDEIKRLWNSRRCELIPLTVTFLCCLLINVEYGILIGTGFHLILQIFMGNRPRPKVARFIDYQAEEERIVIQADVNLYFPGVENFRQTFIELFEGLKEGEQLPHITVDLVRLTEIDFTALKMLESVAAECHKRKAVLQFANATKRLERSIKASIPREHISFVTDRNARDYPVSFVSGQVYKF